MRKNIYLVLSVFIVLGLILTACGGTTTTPTETTAPTTPVEDSEEPAETTAPTEPVAENVTLKIYLLDYTPDTIEWLKSEINPAFEAAHPGVTVEITEGTWSGWDTTFSGFFAAGEGPDIINLGSEMNTLYG